MTIPEELVERGAEALRGFNMQRDGRIALARAVLEAVYTPLQEAEWAAYPMYVLPKYEQVGWTMDSTAHGRFFCEDLALVKDEYQEYLGDGPWVPVFIEILGAESGE